MKNTRKNHAAEVRSFMSNVNKLDKFVHRQTHSELFGTVSLKRAAYESKSGKRVFAVKNSPVMKSGSYSLTGIRERLMDACC